MSDTMIMFDRAQVRFNYRVAAVILDRARVLLQTVEDEDFWCLPGGRAELLEPADECIRREMREEIGEDVTIERLLWAGDTFFEHRGLEYHELGLYFLVTLPHGSPLPQTPEFRRPELDGIQMIFQWFPVSGLESVPLYPAFIRKELGSLPDAPRYFVSRDSKIDRVR